MQHGARTVHRGKDSASRHLAPLRTHLASVFASAIVAAINARFKMIFNVLPSNESCRGGIPSLHANSMIFMYTGTDVRTATEMALGEGVASHHGPPKEIIDGTTMWPCKQPM